MEEEVSKFEQRGADFSLAKKMLQEMLYKTFEAHGLLDLGTPHGFYADNSPGYRRDQAQDGWKKLLVWFKKYGAV